MSSMLQGVCCGRCRSLDHGLYFWEWKIKWKKLVKNSKKNNSQITIYFWHQIVGRMQGEPEVSAGEASSRLLISKHFKHLKSFAYYVNTRRLFDFHHIQLDVNLLWPTLIMFKIAVLQKEDDSNENKTMLMFLNVSFIHGWTWHYIPNKRFIPKVTRLLFQAVSTSALFIKFSAPVLRSLYSTPCSLLIPVY